MRLVVTGGRDLERYLFANKLADIAGHDTAYGMATLAQRPRAFYDRDWVAHGGILTPREQSMIHVAQGLIVLSRDMDAERGTLQCYEQTVSELQSLRTAQQAGVMVCYVPEGVAAQDAYLERLMVDPAELEAS